MFNDVYRGRRVLVTGNTGFKGSWLTVWLRQLGAEVHGLADTVAPTDPAMFGVLGLGERIQHHAVDVREAEKVRSVVETVQPDFLFHLAAQPLVRLSYDEPVATLATNIMGTAHLLDALREAQRPARR